MRRRRARVRQPPVLYGSFGKGRIHLPRWDATRVKLITASPVGLLFSGLLFTCKALQNMQDDPDAELHVCFRRSYDTILKHHHSFIIRSVVTVRCTQPACALTPALTAAVHRPCRSPSEPYLIETTSTAVSRREHPRRSSIWNSPSGWRA